MSLGREPAKGTAQTIRIAGLIGAGALQLRVIAKSTTHQWSGKSAVEHPTGLSALRNVRLRHRSFWRRLASYFTQARVHYRLYHLSTVGVWRE